MLRRSLTFSNAIALIAIFIGLGGSVYAAATIDGKRIKTASLPGNRLEPNSVGGRQAKEATFAKVPAAKDAVSAQVAQTVPTIAGRGPSAFYPAANLRRVRFTATVPEGGPERSGTALELGPLRLTASCLLFNAGGPSAGLLRVQASTSAGGAGWDIGNLHASSSETAGGFLGATPEVVFLGGALDETRRSLMTFLYNDPTATISVRMSARISDTSTESRCSLSGTATRTALNAAP